MSSIYCIYFLDDKTLIGIDVWSYEDRAAAYGLC